MKKIKVIVLLILTALTINGCTVAPSNSAKKITPPKNKQLPIVGTWNIVEIMGESSEVEESEINQWLGKNLRFSDEYIVLGDYFLKDPQYQIKRVNGEEYFLYNHKSFYNEIELTDEQIEVITVIDQDRFFCEIIRINDEQLVLSVNRFSFYLEKVSDEVNNGSDIEEEKKKAESYNFHGHKEDDLMRSGILIGLRTNGDREDYKDSSQPHEYNYRTLWISSKNKNINPILEIEGITFPRRSGFWEIKLDRKTENGMTEDLLNAHKILANNTYELSDVSIDRSQWGKKIGKIYKRIDYIGNDYISVDITGKGGYEDSDKKWYESKLQILPIDNLSGKRNVRMKDLLGEDGIDSMGQGIQKAMSSSNIDRKNVVYSEELLDNFGLERKLGHWLFKGRINHKKDDQVISTDYSINIIPPPKLIIYDELYVPWTSIKDKVPGAVDAYVSPNKEIALVITKNEIIVYGVKYGELEKTPLQRIDLKDNETVIMAEWATGHYVEEWNKFLLDLSIKE